MASKKPYVVVRTYSAGVHMGTLESQKGKEVILSKARRLWRWRGANTLHEVSQKGVNVNEYTRISESVPKITLTEAVEILPCSRTAIASLDRSIWLN